MAIYAVLRTDSRLKASIRRYTVYGRIPPIRAIPPKIRDSPILAIFAEVGIFRRKRSKDKIVSGEATVFLSFFTAVLYKAALLTDSVL
jgi:hypothetical protein